MCHQSEVSVWKSLPHTFNHESLNYNIMEENKEYNVYLSFQIKSGNFKK